MVSGPDVSPRVLYCGAGGVAIADTTDPIGLTVGEIPTGRHSSTGNGTRRGRSFTVALRGAGELLSLMCQLEAAPADSW